MTIFIAGLGLMGTAYAKQLSRAGHTVYGWDENSFHLRQASGFLSGQGLTHLAACDVCIIALPPNATGPFVKKHGADLDHCALMTDLSSVKKAITDAVESYLKTPNTYISHHPMTGFKTAGPKDFDRVQFEGKEVIVIEKPFDLKAKAILFELLRDLKFNPPTVLSALAHDQWVAYTSHLPHVLSAALMHHDRAAEAHSYAGNAFQTMTQYAPLNQALWEAIFQLNQEAIQDEIDGFIQTLEAFKEALNDPYKLRAWMASSHPSGKES